MSGRLSATTAIELQGAARHGDASFRAGHAHGLLLRTNDLLRPPRGKRHEELGAQSHCLALCTNLVMAYSTSCLQRNLDTWRKESGRQITASLQRHVSPMGFEHINFNGVLVFPFEHYRSQLLSPRRGSRIRPIYGGPGSK
jgi:hypothetical protein